MPIAVEFGSAGNPFAPDTTTHFSLEFNEEFITPDEQPMFLNFVVTIGANSYVASLPMFPVVLE